MSKYLKKIIAVVMVVLMVAAYMPMIDTDAVFGVQASAAIVTNGKVKLGDNIKWTYDNKSRTITVSGSGAMYNYSNGDNGQSWDDLVLGFTHYPNKDARKLVISNGITTIGNNVFNGLTGIQSVSIPASVTSIGSGAFKNCSALTSVTVPASVTSIGSSAFEGCSKLSSVSLSNGLKTIGASAFRGTGFKSVALPYTVTSVGAGAFAGISGLRFTCAYGDAAYKYCKSNSASYTLKTSVLVADASLDIANKQVVVSLRLDNAAGLNAANFELTYGSGATFSGANILPNDQLSSSVNVAVVNNGNGKISVAVVAADCVPFEAGKQTISFELAKLTFKINEKADTADFNLSSKVMLLDNARVSATAGKASVGLHEYVEDTANSVAATCIKKGTKALKCSICGKTKSEEIAVNPSNHTGKTELKNVAESTCAVKGYTGDKVCSDCNTVLEKGSEIALLAHTHVLTETVDATCTADGYKKYVCKCGDSYTETITGGTHNYVAQIVEPDCLNAGYTINTCSVCEASYRSDNTESLGHDYDAKGVCTRCGDVNVTEVTFVPSANVTVNNDSKIVASKSARIKISDFISLIDGEGWTVCDAKGNPLDADALTSTGCLLRHSSGTVEYTLIVIGDVNADGKVTAADARLILRRAANLESFTDNQTIASDVDKNNKITASDARKVLRVSSSLDSFQ